MGDAADDYHDSLDRAAMNAEPNDDPPMCEHCKTEEVEELNVEAWEETGLMLCAGCVDEHFEHGLQKAERT